MKASELFPPMYKDMAEAKIKEFFTPQGDEKAPACYVIFLAPVLDENGQQIIKQHKNFLGKVTSEEALTEVMFEPYDDNVIKLNKELFDDLVKANETIIRQNAVIEEQNKVVDAYRELKKQYDNLLNSI